MVNGTNGDDVSVEGIKFVSNLAHRGAKAEFHIESLGNEDDLSVNSKIFMMSARSFEDRGSVGEVCDNLVISVRHMLQDECLEGAIIDLPNLVTFQVRDDVRLGEQALQPVRKSLLVCEEFHPMAPFIPVGFGLIKNKISQP
jgi:hypothetical protein